MHLTIKDFAVVHSAELTFPKGMLVISGETGSGKSLIVDALAFLTGQRAASSMVRHTALRAELQAEFSLKDARLSKLWLQENALDDDNDDHCILRRILYADGGSRAWINGRAVSLYQLEQLAQHLVQIHGQHANQVLLSPQQQLQLLDNYADNQSLCIAVEQAYEQWKTIDTQHRCLLEQLHTPDISELLQHQLDELTALDLEPDAIQKLRDNYKRHSHLAALTEACHAALDALTHDETPSALRCMQNAQHSLGGVAEYEGRINEAQDLISQASIQIDEVGRMLSHLLDALEEDPSRLHHLETQYTRLHDLARKHRCSIEELHHRRSHIAAQLTAVQHADQQLADLESLLEQAQTTWKNASTQLHDARQSAARALGVQVQSILSELGMQGSQFVIDIVLKKESTPSPSGSERCQFLVSTNPGQPLRSLRHVASGGELARIALAIEVAGLEREHVATLIFDEVDMGIGGATAEIVGQKLHDLSAHRQVLCVTHLPQVAAKADTHFRVQKAPREGMTQSAIVHLKTYQDRTDEIARMLGGIHINPETHAAARSLLGPQQKHSNA